MSELFEKETPESYKMWGCRIESALKFFQDHDRGRKKWQQWKDLYTGDHWKKGKFANEFKSSDDPGTYTTANKIGPIVDAFNSFVCNKNPYAVVKPRRPQDVDAARINEGLLNYEWRERDMFEQYRRIVKDASVVHFGVAYVGYKIPLSEETKQSNNPVKDGNLEYKLNVLTDCPEFRRVDPFMFLWDPCAPDHDLDSARWCDEITIHSLQDVMANPNYSDEFKKKVPEIGRSSEEFMDKYGGVKTGEKQNEYDKYVMLHNVWDKKFMYRHVFADGLWDIPAFSDIWPFIYEPDQQIYLDSFPYIMLRWKELINEPFGLSLPAWVEDQQHQRNRNRTYQFLHLRNQSARKYWAEDGVAESEIAKLKDGGDGTVIRTNGPGEQSVGVIPVAPIPNDQYQMESIIDNDMREATGYNELMSGGGLGSASATEAQAVVNYATLQTDDIKNNVDRFLTKVFRMLLQHITANFTTERVVKVMGPEGEYWLTEAVPSEPDPMTGQMPINPQTGQPIPFQYVPKVVTAADIQGEFDIDIQTSTAERYDPNQEKQTRLGLMREMIQMVSVGLQFDPTGQTIPIPDFKELTRFVMEPYHYKDIQRIFPGLTMLPTPTNQVTPLNQGGANNQIPSTPVQSNQEAIQRGAVNGNSTNQGGNGANNY